MGALHQQLNLVHHECIAPVTEVAHPDCAAPTIEVIYRGSAAPAIEVAQQQCDNTDYLELQLLQYYRAVSSNELM